MTLLVVCRVADLLERRSAKDAEMLAEVTDTVAFGKETKGKQRLEFTDMDDVDQLSKG